MLATTLEFQLTHNIGAGEEVRFSFGQYGTLIRRIHGEHELVHVVDKQELDTLRPPLVDSYLGEILLRMAIDLRGDLRISK